MFILECEKCNNPIGVFDGYNEFDVQLCLKCGFSDLDDEQKNKVILFWASLINVIGSGEKT